MRTISQFVEDKIVRWEGEVLHSYDDFDKNHRPIQPGMPVRGTLTIGVGHTGPDVKPGMTITKERSRELLRKDLASFEHVVEKFVKVPLTDNQFGALVSFAFNVGAGNFTGSTLLRKLNKGNYAAVPIELMKWTKSKGKTLPGLINRRTQEAALWGTGEFVSSASVEAKTPNPMSKPEVALPAGATGVIAAAAPVFAGADPIRIAIALAILALVAGGAWFAWKRLRA